MSKAAKTQDINLTNLLFGIIILFLAFLSIDQKYSYIQNSKKQEKLYSLLEWRASFVETEFLKSEGRRLAFANHFRRQNLASDESVEKLLTLGGTGIKAYLSLPENSNNVLSEIQTYGVTSRLFTPSLIRELPIRETREQSIRNFQSWQETEKFLNSYPENSSVKRRLAEAQEYIDKNVSDEAPISSHRLQMILMDAFAKAETTENDNK
tara:strand:- start:115 stop:741 length:627 start_codon:yes stop_codon:yes gene_type:complete